ncbi:MAG: DUF5615 family PIN-like protein [Bacteroidota bacterium]
MKLLFDENISYRILPPLSNYFMYVASASSFPAIRTDEQLWAFAKEKQFTLVTHDQEFETWAQTRKEGPKVVFLAFHPLAPDALVEKLAAAQAQLQAFAVDSEAKVITLS